jgi:hypothetical protein
MGGGGSKARSETHISNEIVNESVFKALNSTRNVTSSSVLANQKLVLKGVKAKSCKMNVNQKLDMDVKVMAKFEQSDATELNKLIESELDQKLKSDTSSESGFGDVMSGGSETSDYTNIKNKVSNRMNTEITNETVNELRTKIVANQELIMENYVMDPLGFEILRELGFPPTIEMMRLASQTTCDINQDLQIKFVAEQIGSKVSKIIQDEATKTLSKSDTEKTTTSKTQGAGEAVADAAEGIGTGVATAAEGVGAGVGDAAQGIGAGAAAAMAGPFIPFAISSSSMMAAGMVMMMMSKGGGGMDPAVMAAMMRR